MKHLKITYNGKAYEVDVEESGVAQACAPDHSKTAQPAGSSAPVPPTAGTAVPAPMSGRIVKILVNVGDTIAADDPIAILEAMKLENEIYSDCGGVVREIRVKQNQIVNTEDTIAIIG